MLTCFRCVGLVKSPRRGKKDLVVVHRLVPLPHRQCSGGFNLKSRGVVVTRNGDGQVDGIAPNKRGVEREQRCAHTVVAAPSDRVSSGKHRTLPLVVQDNLDDEGAVVGKRERVGMGCIGRTLTHPVR